MFKNIYAAHTHTLKPYSDRQTRPYNLIFQHIYSSVQQHNLATLFTQQIMQIHYDPDGRRTSTRKEKKCKEVYRGIKKRIWRKETPNGPG